MDHELLFTGPELARRAQVAYQTLNLWAHDGLLIPSVSNVTGRGTRRLYSPADAVAVEAIKLLRARGAPRASVYAAVRHIQSKRKPDVEAYVRHAREAAHVVRSRPLVVVGAEGRIADVDDGELRSAIRKEGGAAFVLDIEVLAENALVSEVESKLKGGQGRGPRRPTQKPARSGERTIATDAVERKRRRMRDEKRGR